jgi:hypothetical protein
MRCRWLWLAALLLTLAPSLLAQAPDLPPQFDHEPTNEELANQDLRPKRPEPPPAKPAEAETPPAVQRHEVPTGQSHEVMVEQKKGAPPEAELPRVALRKEFRSFYGGAAGETSLTPELELVDEFFDRLIHHKRAFDLASPSAVMMALAVVEDAQHRSTAQQWREHPTLGRLGACRVEQHGGVRLLHFAASGTPELAINIQGAGKSAFITHIQLVRTPAR